MACLLSGSSLIAGTVSGQSLFELDTLRDTCVSIESYPVEFDTGDCRVVDFDLLTNVDGSSYYYARYQISTDVPIWPSLRDGPREANALVLFAGEEGSDHLRVYRTDHEGFAEFRAFDFPVPEEMDISLGRILALAMERLARAGCDELVRRYRLVIFRRPIGPEDAFAVESDHRQ